MDWGGRGAGARVGSEGRGQVGGAWGTRRGRVGGALACVHACWLQRPGRMLAPRRLLATRRRVQTGCASPLHGRAPPRRPLGALIDNASLGYTYQRITWAHVAQQPDANGAAAGAGGDWSPLLWTGPQPAPPLVSVDELTAPAAHAVTAPLQRRGPGRCGSGRGGGPPGEPPAQQHYYALGPHGHAPPPAAGGPRGAGGRPMIGGVAGWGGGVRLAAGVAFEAASGVMAPPCGQPLALASCQQGPMVPATGADTSLLALLGGGAAHGGCAMLPGGVEWLPSVQPAAGSPAAPAACWVQGQQTQPLFELPGAWPAHVASGPAPVLADSASCAAAVSAPPGLVHTTQQQQQQLLQVVLASEHDQQQHQQLLSLLAQQQAQQQVLQQALQQALQQLSTQLHVAQPQVPQQALQQQVPRQEEQQVLLQLQPHQQPQQQR